MNLRALELDHHAGPRLIALVPGERIRETVYRYVRQTHDFLDDENHFVSFADHTVRIHRPWDYCEYWFESHWFSQYWRIVTPHTFNERIAAHLKWREKWLAEAETCRDTVRGRRARKRLLSNVSEMERQVRVDCRRKLNLIDGKFWPEVQW